MPNDKEIVLINESPTMLEDCLEGMRVHKSI